MTLSERQISKLRNGHVCQIKCEDIQDVLQNMNLKPDNHVALMNALKKRKGARIRLDEEEIMGNGFIKNVSKLAKKGKKALDKADAISERVTGKKLSDHAKEKGMEYIDLKIGKDNRMKLQDMGSQAKQMYDSYNAGPDIEGGNIFNDIKKSINKSNKAIEKGFNKNINKRTITKAANQANKGLKAGLKAANKVTNSLGMDNVVDVGVDEVLGRTLTPFVGATASNMVGNKIKDGIHSAGYGMKNPYLPDGLTKGGSFMTHSYGGSFNTHGGSVGFSNKGSGEFLKKRFPNTRIKHDNFI